MKTFFVINPNSANGQTGKKWPEISGELSRALEPFDFAFTEEAMHATRLATEAIGKGYECIVAVGGDGTINEVVNGFFSDGKLISRDSVLAVLPRGTGGDFRKTFGWEADLTSSIGRLKGQKTRPLDVGVVEYIQHGGKAARRYFVNICSFGASGVCDREVNRTTKAFGGKASFMWGSVKALMKYTDKKVTISLDGGAGEAAAVTTLAVANGKYFGGGMCVCPGADPGDGVFDVTLWSGYGLADFVLKSKAIYSGEHIRFPGTKTFRCRTLEATSDDEVLLDVDGEQPGRLPCKISILPSELQLKT